MIIVDVNNKPLGPGQTVAKGSKCNGSISIRTIRNITIGRNGDDITSIHVSFVEGSYVKKGTYLDKDFSWIGCVYTPNALYYRFDNMLLLETP